MIILGLTGSVGMGKTTTAGFFAEEGAMVWNADQAVHALYAEGGAGVGPVGDAFPGVVVDGAVDRDRLAAALGRDESAFRRLEQIVHPLVARGRYEDLEAARTRGVRLAVLDIPLLFETGANSAVDAVVVVTADADLQVRRVLSRPGMTRERFEAIASRQMADAEKRRRADFIIDTGKGLDAAKAEVRQIVHTVLSPGWQRPLPREHEASQ